MKPGSSVVSSVRAAVTQVSEMAPAALVDVALRVQRAAAGLRRHEVRVGGFKWVYLDNGGNGEPLVLVHGFGGDKDNWTRLAPHLRHHYRLIVPDLPGFGDSDSPLDAQYRVQDHVERLHEFLAALGIGRAHIAGNSMGGFITALYAATYPTDTASIWLIDNAGAMSAAPSELLQTIDSGGDNPLIPSTLEQFRGLMSYVMSRPPYFPRAVLDVMGRRAIAARELRLKQFQEILDHSPHLEDVMGGVTTPTHILWGEKDRLLHVDSVRVLKQLLPQASATVLPGIGHVPMLECPGDTARDYLSFRVRLRAQNA